MNPYTPIPTLPPYCPTIIGCGQVAGAGAQTPTGIPPCGAPTLSPPGCTIIKVFCPACHGGAAGAQAPTPVPTASGGAVAQTGATLLGCQTFIPLCPPTANCGQAGAQTPIPTLPPYCPTIIGCGQVAGAGAQTPTGIPPCGAPTLSPPGCTIIKVFCPACHGGAAGAQAPTPVPTASGGAVAQTGATLLGCQTFIPLCPPTANCGQAGAQTPIPTLPPYCPTIIGCGQVAGAGAQTPTGIPPCGAPTLSPPGCTIIKVFCPACHGGAAGAQAPTPVPTASGGAVAQTGATLLGCQTFIPLCPPTANCGQAGAQTPIPTLPPYCPTIIGCGQVAGAGAQTPTGIPPCGAPTLSPPGCTIIKIFCPACHGGAAGAQAPTPVPTASGGAQAQTMDATIGVYNCITHYQATCIPTLPICDQGSGAGAQTPIPTLPPYCPTIVACPQGGVAQTPVPTMTGCSMLGCSTYPVCGQGGTVAQTPGNTVCCVQSATAIPQCPPITLTREPVCTAIVNCNMTIPAACQGVAGAQTPIPTLPPYCPTIIGCPQGAAAQTGATIWGCHTILPFCPPTVHFGGAGAQTPTILTCVPPFC